MQWKPTYIYGDLNFSESKQVFANLFSWRKLEGSLIISWKFQGRTPQEIWITAIFPARSKVVSYDVLHQESGANQGENPGIGESPSNQPISGPVIFSKRQALSRAVVVNSNMSRGKYLAREGPGSRLDVHRQRCWKRGSGDGQRRWDYDTTERSFHFRFVRRRWKARFNAPWTVCKAIGGSP